jgi:hypothetical protein
MNPLSNIASCLAHSLVFFTREEYLPASAAQGNATSSNASSLNSATNQELSGETEGDQSPFTQVGANSKSAAVNGGVSLQQGNVTSGKGGTVNDITTIESSDPDVVEAALSANEDVSAGAAELANNALTDLAGVATSSIEAGVLDTQANAAAGESALNDAAQAEAEATTEEEASATESTTVASNGLAAAENETLAGVTPAQLFQQVQPATPSTLASSTTASQWATYLGIAVAVVTLIYFFRKGKVS